MFLFVKSHTGHFQAAERCFISHLETLIGTLILRMNLIMTIEYPKFNKTSKSIFVVLGFAGGLVAITNGITYATVKAARGLGKPAYEISVESKMTGFFDYVDKIFYKTGRELALK